MTQGMSVFYINTNNNDVSQGLTNHNAKIVEAYKNGGNPGFDGFYAVFGQLNSGYEVLDVGQHINKMKL